MHEFHEKSLKDKLIYNTLHLYYRQFLLRYMSSFPRKENSYCSQNLQPYGSDSVVTYTRVTTINTFYVQIYVGRDIIVSVFSYDMSNYFSIKQQFFRTSLHLKDYIRSLRQLHIYLVWIFVFFLIPNFNNVSKKLQLLSYVFTLRYDFIVVSYDNSSLCCASSMWIQIT